MTAKALITEDLIPRLDHVDEIIVFVKSKSGNYFSLSSENTSKETRDAAIKMLKDTK